jgi:NAD(P)H-hydrate epimerase
LDTVAITQYDLSGALLMTRAGHAAMALLDHSWPNAQKIVVCCGSGNNGGDGYVIAGLAQHAGLGVTVYELGSPENMSEETLQMREMAIQTGVTFLPFEGSVIDSDVIVDAIFGTGLCRNVSGHYSDCIDKINESTADVLSIDIPSGLNADTGSVMGAAVFAQHTISFIGLNRGLFTGKGPAHTGQIHYHGLGVPERIFKPSDDVTKRLSLSQFAPLCQPRQRSAHKGDFGHVAIIGGDHGYGGAALMAASASARTGAGLTSIATHKTHTAAILSAQPELMCHSVEHRETLNTLLHQVTTLVLGPGLGQSEWSQMMFNESLKHQNPMVVDADGLNWLARQPQHRNNWVLTPHPGEAARLLQTDTQSIQADRFSAVTQLQQRYGGTVVLKGAGTLIYDGQHPIAMCTDGNPGMASGGMGDILAGVIGGLLAQGLSAYDAACLGVLVHAMAADKAATNEGERGLLATDLLPYIRRLLNLINDER